MELGSLQVSAPCVSCFWNAAPAAGRSSPQPVLACRKYAFGYDELLPLSQTSNTWFDLGLTLVDALDTLLLLGLEAEYEEVQSSEGGPLPDTAFLLCDLGSPCGNKKPRLSLLTVSSQCP